VALRFRRAERQFQVGDLREERLLVRTYCEHAEELTNFRRANAIPVDHAHEVNSERDLTS
jgi:hypothetical protein